MNQHFVPEFYLKNFSIDRKQIFVYDKVIQKVFSNSISSVASKNGFYDDGNQNSLEKTLGALETKTGVVVKKLLDKITKNENVVITTDEKDVLISFIWLQMNRTIESRIELGSIESHLISKITGEPYSLETNDLLKNAETKDEHLSFLYDNIENSFALNEFRNRNFLIARNDTAVDFITSDNPVVTYNHWEISHMLREIFIPMNSKTGLWLVPKGFYKEIDQSDNKVYIMKVASDIEFYNYLQISQSTRQLFSTTTHFNHVPLFLQKNPSLREINRKRLD